MLRLVFYFNGIILLGYGLPVLAALGYIGEPGTIRSAGLLLVLLIPISAMRLDDLLPTSWNHTWLLLPLAVLLSGIWLKSPEVTLTAGAMFTAICTWLGRSGWTTDKVCRALVLSLAMWVTASLVLTPILSLQITDDRQLVPWLFAGRYSGLLGHPNTLGFISALLIGSSLVRIKQHKLAFTLGCLGLAASGSQTGILAVLLAVGLQVLNAKSRRVGLYSGALTCLTLLLLNLAVALGWSSLLPFNRSGLTGRVDIWEYLWGASLTLFGTDEISLVVDLESRFGVLSTHNSFLEIVTRYGLVALCALAVSVLAFIIGGVVRGDAWALLLMAMLLTMGLAEAGVFTLPGFVLALAMISIGNGLPSDISTTKEQEVNNMDLRTAT